MYKLKKPSLIILLITLIACPAFSTTYLLPSSHSRLIGHTQTISVQPGDTFSSVARSFNVGYYELFEANRHTHPEHIRPHMHLIIPSQYILPDMPHQGIIINLAEMRLYYFPPNTNKVVTVPVGIGRLDWSTPTGSMHIIEKHKNPTWFVPESIREARASEGIFLPNSVPPGPQNPLGHYALRLSRRTYLIHGTNQPQGIGLRVTSGCIRLYPEDIESLFSQVKKGTQVHIINQAYKVGWVHNTLYLEVHEPLQENYPDDLVSPAVRLIKNALKQHQIPNTTVDWKRVKAIAYEQSGIPLPVTHRQ